MILHGGYNEETDEFRKIRGQLELEETVRTLLQQPGQVADTFDGNVQALHAPGVNYVVGHGIAGLAIDWLMPGEFADQLVNLRNLAAGDIIQIITCMAGVPGGAAQELAKAIGDLGVDRVTVRGPVGFIHWNTNGELLLTDYGVVDNDLKRAGREWTDVEDTAWHTYVRRIKTKIIDKTTAAWQANEAAAGQLIAAFAANRPDDNKKEGIDALIPKITGAATPPERLAACVQIVQRAKAVRQTTQTGRFYREGTHKDWSQELRTLLKNLYVLTDATNGETAATAKISNWRAKMRTQLAAGWPAYSTGYFDRLRIITRGTPKQSTWNSYTSTVPQVLPQPVLQVTAPTPDLDAVLTNTDVQATRNDTDY